MMQSLIDRHGRRMRKLRLSLLDACNFRCLYCMPLKPTFMNQSEWLNVEELVGLTALLVDCGLEQVRVTGGEPTLRPEFREIMSRLSALPLKKLGLTTNGFSLHQHLEFLLETRCRHLNISLDSLEPENFKKLTRSAHFDNVIRSILEAKRLGFDVKINVVLIRGLNDHEVSDFVDFSAQHQVEVRFLELMKIGQARALGENGFISAAEVIRGLEKTRSLIRKEVEFDSTSFNYVTACGARIGFIASESQPFCSSCSRLRLSANGILRACLMNEHGISVKGLSRDQMAEALVASMEQKPHARKFDTSVDMNRLGG